jgi:hypothetical protein
MLDDNEGARFLTIQLGCERVHYAWQSESNTRTLAQLCFCSSMNWARPAALLTGLWMYKIRPGKVAEASVIGVLSLFGVGLAVVLAAA